MAVQAQHPSHTLLPNFRNRVRQSGTIDTRSFISPPSTTTALSMLDDLQLQPAAAVNLLRAYNSAAGLKFGQQLNAAMLVNETENEMACNLVASRKRPRGGEDMLTRQRPFISIMDHEKQAGASLVIPQAAGSISTGLRLSFDDNRLNPSAASTSGRGNSTSLSSAFAEELNAQFMKQREEIDQLIKIQGERMKQYLEEKRQRHNRTLLTVIEEGVLDQLREKESELDKMNRRNLELEEQMKQLSLESQLWQNLAKNNELVASNLRTSLEQIVAQTREQSREGSGESEVDDAESCQYGDTRDVHARTFKENKELKEQRMCRVCRTNNVCILLLPCRHLCLCKDCENRLDKCPLCRSVKNASVQVYMS